MTEEKTTWIEFELMESFMIDVLKGRGLPLEDAQICADVLITADRMGIDSHGIGRLKPIYYDRIKLGILNPQTRLEIVKEGPTTAVLDANNGMGMVAGKKAMQMAIDKARNLGLGMTAVRNSSHYGIAGYYALMAINAGMIGITGTNARPSIAPTFGVENMLGTNPLTIGLPSDEEFPFLLDSATSVTQRGKIEVYEREGKNIPSGWVIDEKGQTRTDTSQVLIDLVKGKAALTPLGGLGEDTAGYKGYNYATVVEILSSALQSGRFMKDLTGFDSEGQPRPYQLGHFFLAINIEAFTSLDSFKKTSGEILRSIRESRKAPGADRIYTAGEKEHLIWLERKDKGVPVNSALQRNMIDMRDELGLNAYHFPFES